LVSPPPISFGEIPHNLNLVHKSLLYILPCLLYPPDLGVDAVDIGIVTPLGNIAILVSCSADSVSVNYLHLQLLLLNNLEPWWSLKSPPSWL
jgi:hypothetical protein